MITDTNYHTIPYSETNFVYPTYVIIKRESFKNIINNAWIRGVLKGIQLSHENKSTQSVFYSVWGGGKKNGIL